MKTYETLIQVICHIHDNCFFVRVHCRSLKAFSNSAKNVVCMSFIFTGLCPLVNDTSYFFFVISDKF